MLAKSRQDVHFLLNSDYQQVKEHGLLVESVLGDFVLKPINAYSTTTEMPKADVVLVCLKTTNNYLLKELLYPIMHEDTIVILIQNGLGVEQQAADSYNFV